MNIQNKAGYTAVMLACLTAPDGPGGMEVVRKLMELGNIHLRSSQVIQTRQTRFKCNMSNMCSSGWKMEDGKQSNSLLKGHYTLFTHENMLTCNRVLLSLQKTYTYNETLKGV